jgi:hypothetical protein
MPKIQYVAFDDECFSSEQECLEYENKQVAILKPSIISQWIDEQAVSVDWRTEETSVNVMTLFAHLNTPANSLLTEAFLESFVENLSASNCAYLAHLLDN